MACTPPAFHQPALMFASAKRETAVKVKYIAEERYTLNVWSRGKQLVLFSREC